MQPGTSYKTYILRVWQVEHGTQPALVAMLEDCETNERQAFADLAALMAFLEARGQAQSPIPCHDCDTEET